MRRNPMPVWKGYLWTIKRNVEEREPWKNSWWEKDNWRVKRWAEFLQTSLIINLKKAYDKNHMTVEMGNKIKDICGPITKVGMTSYFKQGMSICSDSPEKERLRCFLEKVYPDLYRFSVELNKVTGRDASWPTPEQFFGLEKVPEAAPEEEKPKKARKVGMMIKFLKDSHYTTALEAMDVEPWKEFKITEESTTEYYIFIKGGLFSIDKSDEGELWNFTSEVPKGKGVPKAVKPWQLVEGGKMAPEVRKSLLDVIQIVEPYKKLRSIHEILQENFVWTEPATAKKNDIGPDEVFVSVFLIKDGSLVLKGVPGTGKTQLIEMATMMFANDIMIERAKDLEHFVRQGKSGPIWEEGYKPQTFWKGGDALLTRKMLMEWLEKRGVIGMAKHNADKEIQDVFFTTDIAIEHYKNWKMTKETHEAIEVAAEKEVEEQERLKKEGPEKAKVPIASTKEEEAPPGYWELAEKTEDDIGRFLPKKKGGIPRAKDLFNPRLKKNAGIHQSAHQDHFAWPPYELDTYSFMPVPREIVTSVIKFHNEANRMNPDVADALLGIMAEKEVEFQGKVFPSPGVYDEENRRVIYDDQGIGQLSFLDYNPHLEVEHPEMELDRALLDRITAGIFLSGGKPSTRFSILDKRVRGTSMKPRDIVFGLIKKACESNGKKGIVPITRLELEGLWQIKDNIPVDPEIVAWISYLTNIPNLTNRAYTGQYLDAMAGLPIDKTLMVFNEVYENFPDLEPTGMVEEDVQAGIDGLQRPMGSRGAESLLDLYRAWVILNEAERGKKKPWEITMFIKSDKDRKRVFKELTQLLPYVIDHRLNLGLSADLKQQFMSSFDLISHYFVPMLEKRQDKIFAIMESCMNIFAVNENAKLEGNRPPIKQKEGIENTIKFAAEKVGVPVGEFKDEISKDSLLSSLIDIIPAIAPK